MLKNFFHGVHIDLGDKNVESIPLVSPGLFGLGKFSYEGDARRWLLADK